MTTSVKALLEAYERLSDPERADFASEILRRTSSGDLGGEDLAQVADDTFLRLDAREAADGGELSLQGVRACGY